MQPPNQTADVFAKTTPPSGAAATGSGSGSTSQGEASRGTETMECDICIIGAGSGGLSVAAVAASFGVKVVLLEKHKMGGDCLNYGCVPSKALLAASKRAHLMRSPNGFGVAPHDPAIDYSAVHDHVHSVIAAIQPNDSVERFTGLGVHVIEAAGRFIDKNTVEAGERKIKARRFVIATGSSPLVPPIPGLDTVPYFTNETIFENQKKIDHLLIVGGGPIGMELAQAHRRLGSRVTVLEGAKALGKDDPELTKVVLEHLRAEGIDIREGTLVTRVEEAGGKIRVHVKVGDSEDMVEGSHILIAAGRKPNVDDLGLDKAGVKYDKRGIKTDSGLVTSNSKVYAIGDVIGGLQFTHVANYHAGIVIRKALFRHPFAKVDETVIPWVTFTDPELAHVGLSEDQAVEKHGKVSVLRWPYHENDRAQAERATSGHVKVVTDKKGRILGATIVGDHAGELIQMWALAVSQKMKIGAMTGWISPYPTFSEVNKRAAYKFYAGATANPVIRKIIGLLAKLG